MSELFEQIYNNASDKCDPTQVKIDLNHSCNLKCIHCYVEQKNTEQLNLQQLCHFFDQLVEMNTLRMVFTGGEPLLRSDFKQIIQEAAARGFIIEVLTNGTLIDKEMAMHFRKNRVCEVQVSLHGSSPEMHDQITTVPGSFKKALKGIRHLQNAGVKVILACNLVKSNYKYWHEIKSFAEQELKLKIQMSYWLVENEYNEHNLPKCELTVEQMAEYLNGLYQTKSVKELRGDQSGDLDARICLAGVNNCRLLPNGDIVPCARIMDPMGNIFENDFRTIWNESPLGQKLRKLRRRDLKKCVQCEDYEICPICPGFSFHKTRDFLSAVDNVCKYVHMDGNIRRNIIEKREN